MKKPETNLWDQYKYIVAWGKMLGSYAYYIEDQIRNAIAENAPYTAIYNRDGRWITYEEIQNPETKYMIDKLINKK